MDAWSGKFSPLPLFDHLHFDDVTNFNFCVNSTFVSWRELFEIFFFSPVNSTILIDPVSFPPPSTLATPGALHRGGRERSDSSSHSSFPSVN